MPSIDLQKITLDTVHLPHLKKEDTHISILRLDKVHQVASGNKLFKLKYHLEKYHSGNYKGILTFGGAWSNHVLATACVCNSEKIPCVGIIRGETPEKISYTLQKSISYGMHVEFLSRDLYKQKALHPIPDTLDRQYPGYYVIPEGGSGLLGEKGITELFQSFQLDLFSHIACAIGTGTMWKGLLKGSKNDQHIVGIPVLKGYKEITNENIYPEFHFGGYAKYTPALITFMNELYRETGIPTDIVYTGKLMYAVRELTREGRFSSGSRICIIHSGGLQGNYSLPQGTLIF